MKKKLFETVGKNKFKLTEEEYTGAAASTGIRLDAAPKNRIPSDFTGNAYGKITQPFKFKGVTYNDVEQIITAANNGEEAAAHIRNLVRMRTAVYSVGRYYLQGNIKSIKSIANELNVPVYLVNPM